MITPRTEALEAAEYIVDCVLDEVGNVDADMSEDMRAAIVTAIAVYLDGRDFT